ncbi:hypothetical protein M8818_006256 [Zalaria obscura]|uniref:Uncharacterized protein n=1 Tax=Zalaria obscura TaxID=2024903 RepID=A0ACC3SBR2_9PEZI
MSKKSSQEVSLLVTGVQLGSQRYSKQHRDAGEVPKIAMWRCNLTGLSYVHNLYFVAYAGNIYVFEPQFPTQELPPHPALIIDTEPSASGLIGGYIDPREPRAINNLVLQFLDISGTTRLWDVHRLSREEMTKMRWSSARAGSGLRADSGLGFDGFDRLNAGWGVLFLDSRSFCKVNNILDAVGTHLSQHTADAQIWDISDAVQNLPDQGPIYAQIADSQPNNVMDGNFNDPAPLAPIPRSHPLQTRDSPTIPATHAGPSNDVSSGVDEDEEMDEDEEIDENEGSDSGQAADDSPEGSEYTQDYTDQELEEPAFLSIHRDCNLALHDRLPCPILHTSLSNLYLFQPSPAGTLPAGTPLLMLADPWQQSLPLEHYWLQRMQRCNMLAQIPSLSVVIVGNQKGRVLILSLTQVHSMDKHVYAFRIAHMLPRRNQELAGHRPMSPLHGIAVGPMQGTENLPDNKKRWRLMIMYQDHTVLSYEFGKSDHDLELREVMI